MNDLHRFKEGDRVRGGGNLRGRVVGPEPRAMSEYDRGRGTLRIAVVWDGGDGRVSYPMLSVVSLDESRPA